MMINRHNYEAFFLLYVDNELSAADRKTVEVFVQENPDLGSELLALQQTVLKPDDIRLDKKDWLYMEEEATALQENLLLYADDELSASEKKAVEYLLASDTAVINEWNILKQTKLQPDLAVVFEDKQLLYRQPGAKHIAFKWWRAAAAVLLGFGLWAGTNLWQGNHTSSTGSQALVSSTEESSGKKITETAAEKVQPRETADKRNTAEIPEQQNSNKAAAISKIPEAGNKDAHKNGLRGNDVAVQHNGYKKPDNDLPKSYLENINNPQRNETITASVLPENKNNKVVSGNNEVAKTISEQKMSNTLVPNRNLVNPADPASMTVTQVVQKITPGENNDRYLNVDDDKEKRTVLGGFLRKAKRVLERTTNVKTGEGIKIAGFEIAL